MEDKKILWLDTETTGLDPKTNSIIQVAGLVEINGEIKDKFELKCRPTPGAVIAPESMSVTGYTEDQINSFPEPNELYKKLNSLFGKYIDKYDRADKFIIAGYNVQFDVNMLDAFYRSFGDKYLGSYLNFGIKIDVLPLVNILRYIGHVKTENAKLETACKYFNIEIQAHDAFSDIVATRDLFLGAIKKYITPMEEV
jgi:DNA polymerase-3 subunit epsilon